MLKKYIRTILSAGLAALTLVACQKQEDEVIAPIINLVSLDPGFKGISAECYLRTAGSSEIQECGIYYGQDENSLTQKKVSDRVFPDRSGGTFFVLADEVEEDKQYYVKAYAITKDGDNTSEVLSATSLIIPKQPLFNIPEEMDERGARTAKATFSVMLTYTPIKEYGYYIAEIGADAPELKPSESVPEGKKVKIADAAIKEGESFQAEFTDLKNGTWYLVTPYGVNDAGETVKQDPISFFTKVQGRGADTNIYEELPAVKNEDGSICLRFLDRNLGAPKVPKSPDDVENAGWMYQWGRPTDGHQIPTSDLKDITKALYDKYEDIPEEDRDKFFTGEWRWTKDATMWNATDGGRYNPCPEGYRVPTFKEWEALRSLCGSKKDEMEQYTHYTKHDCDVYLNFTFSGEVAKQRFPKTKKDAVETPGDMLYGDGCGYYSCDVQNPAATWTTTSYFMMWRPNGDNKMQPNNKYKGCTGMYIRCIRLPEPEVE